MNLSGHDRGVRAVNQYNGTFGAARGSLRSGGRMSRADVLLEPDDAGELVDVEAGAPDEGTVDVRLAEE